MSSQRENKKLKQLFHLQIQHFLQFVKSIYSELPKHLPKIFEPRPALRVKDLSEINIDALLTETFTITAIQSEKKAADGTVVTVSILFSLYVHSFLRGLRRGIGT